LAGGGKVRRESKKRENEKKKEYAQKEGREKILGGRLREKVVEEEPRIAPIRSFMGTAK